MKFVFDLDGTVTRVETLPLIARHFGVEAEIAELTAQTIAGHVPFAQSLRRRVAILGALPVDAVSALLATVELHPGVAAFIRAHADDCRLATGNLSCWVDRLSARIGCRCHTSTGLVRGNRVVEVQRILDKAAVVRDLQADGERVTFIGEGNNDADAMVVADVAIATALTHEPAPNVSYIADHIVSDEDTLCALLDKLRGGCSC